MSREVCLSTPELMGRVRSCPRRGSSKAPKLPSASVSWRRSRTASRALEQLACSVLQTAEGTAASAATQDAPDAPFAALCDWVRWHKGHVHEALDLGVTSTASRAVVARRDIPAAEQRQAGCILNVPASLELNADVAAHHLRNIFRSAGLDERSPADQFTYGADSAWAPFIRTLPEEHQCGYLLEPAGVPELLRGFVQGGHLHPDNVCDWQRHQDECRASVRQALQAHSSVLAALDVSIEEAEWAFGQVTSRSFSCCGRRLMVPLLDCLNHSPAAQKLCKWSQCGRLRYGCSHSNGERAGSSASTLRRGEELFLDYGVHYRLWDPAESHTPFQPCIADNLIPELQAFTRWGFVPEHD